MILSILFNFWNLTLFYLLNRADPSKYYNLILKLTWWNILTYDPAVNEGTVASGRRYQGITLTGLIRCKCNAHKKQSYVKQLYNPVPQTVSFCWRQLVGVRNAVRGSENQLQTEGLRLSETPVEQPSRLRKKCCYCQRNLGSIFCSLFRLQLTSHT